MEESQLRQVILGKLRDQTLPRDASFANTITRAGEIVIREARGEPCSICGEAILPGVEYPRTFYTDLDRSWLLAEWHEVTEHCTFSLTCP